MWGNEMKLTFRTAVEADHPLICAIARESPYTKDFGNTIMFSGPAHYAKGWIRVAMIQGGHIVGFTCRREKVRVPRTKLYFLGAYSSFRRQGMGSALVCDLQNSIPPGRGDIELSCARDNLAARALYLKLGFSVERENDDYYYMFRKGG